jgi:hypothetical protein
MARSTLSDRGNNKRAAAAAPKRPRGRPRTGIGRSLGLRLYPDLEAAIDRWIRQQPKPRPSLPEAIRKLVWRGLD